MSRTEKERLLEVLARLARHLQGLHVGVDALIDLVRLARTEEELVKK